MAHSKTETVAVLGAGGLQFRHDLAVAFAAFQARNFTGVSAVDRDPAEYVREAEDVLSPPPSGSLGIGSLKSQ
jgi:hypothetical protein